MGDPETFFHKILNVDSIYYCFKIEIISEKDYRDNAIFFLIHVTSQFGMPVEWKHFKMTERTFRIQSS